MKNIILSILLLIVTISPNLRSQELPVFGITGVNTDEFPLVKSYIVAKNGYLNEFTLSGEGFPNDEINLPLQPVGPILSCESTPFNIVLQNSTPSAVNVTGVLSQSELNFNLISTLFTIEANSSANATIDYNPSGLGTHDATMRFNFSDGIIVNALIQDTTINSNVDLINFTKAKYTTPIGLIANTEFDINLNSFDIRFDNSFRRICI